MQTRHILIASTKNTHYILTGGIWEGKILFALLPFLYMTWFLKSWLFMFLQVISWWLQEGTITHFTWHFNFHAIPLTNHRSNSLCTYFFQTNYFIDFKVFPVTLNFYDLQYNSKAVLNFILFISKEDYSIWE